jgi:hypothetical protein
MRRDHDGDGHEARAAIRRGGVDTWICLVAIAVTGCAAAPTPVRIEVVDACSTPIVNEPPVLAWAEPEVDAAVEVEDAAVILIAPSATIATDGLDVELEQLPPGTYRIDVGDGVDACVALAVAGVACSAEIP